MPFPNADEIQASLGASWRLMQGRADALRQMDISADGFWNSFFSFVVAVPPLFVLWTRDAIEIAPAGLSERLGVVLRLATVEAVAWFAPILLVGLALNQIGRADRIVPFVVANNWGTALISWIVLPIILLAAFVPSQAEIAAILFFFAFMASIILFWRMNNAVLNMGPTAPTVSVGVRVVLTVLISYGMRSLLAVPSAAG